MVTINQDGVVLIAAVHPRLMQAFERVKELQNAIDRSTGAEADRQALHRQLEGWLHELKYLTLVAFRYWQDHIFFDLANNPFDESEDCPADATVEQQFQHANDLTITAVRLDIETFHVFTSTILDRIVRIFPVYFGKKDAI